MISVLQPPNESSGWIESRPLPVLPKITYSTMGKIAWREGFDADRRPEWLARANLHGCKFSRGVGVDGAGTRRTRESDQNEVLKHVVSRSYSFNLPIKLAS